MIHNRIQKYRAMKLVIVESPAKCSKIQSFLGKDYVVLASYGHIRNLAKNNAIDVNNEYKPKYVISNHQVVKKLRAACQKADEVIIASDMDREGEAIGYHLMKVLKLPMSTKRIVFNKITKKAIEDAIHNPRALDSRLFHSQQARRVLDRLIGFSLSPLLWKHVASKLSAGRCQSPALGLVFDKEQQISSFQNSSQFKIEGTFSTDTTGNHLFEAKFKLSRPSKEETIKHILRCIKTTFHVSQISSAQFQTCPPPPFRTSTLQQAASNRGISPKECMQHAQKLYEAGLITYMRTDSTVLSSGIKESCTQFIKSKWSAKYLSSRKNNTRVVKKAKHSQDAHEAIRPVKITVTPGSLQSMPPRRRIIYDLIWKRTLASQMAAKVSTKCTWFIDSIAGSTCDDSAVSEHIRVDFNGWTILYEKTRSDEEEREEEQFWTLISAVSEGTVCHFKTFKGVEQFKSPPTRYTEARLIKELEDNGIGRPSTFSSIISTIVDRHYVRIEDDPGTKRTQQIISSDTKSIMCEEHQICVGNGKKRMFLTDIGCAIVSFLKQHFDFIMRYSYTSTLEEQLDSIAIGDLKWTTCVDEAYQKIKTNTTLMKSTVNDGDASHSSRLSAQKRCLGNHPESGLNVYVFIGKKGKVIQHGEDGDTKTTYCSWNTRRKIENINLEHVLDQIPRVIGQINGHDVCIANGPYGKYIRCGQTTVPIPKDKSVDVSELTLEKCEQFIQEYQQDTRIVCKTPQIIVKKGPYGFYVRKGKVIRSLPEDIDWNTVTKDECLEILAKPKPKRKAGGKSRTKTKTKGIKKTRSTKLRKKTPKKMNE